MKKPLRALAMAGLMTVWELGFWYLVSRVPPVSPRLVQSLSPTNQGIAAFVREEGPAGWRIRFYACDPSHGRDPQRMKMAYESNGAVRFSDAVWAKDGTLIAVRAYILGREAIAGLDVSNAYFVAAYDFRVSRAVGEEELLNRRAALIQKTLARRGGPGKVALPSADAFDNYVMSDEEKREYDMVGR